MAQNDRRPAEVFPPGEFIREELEERGWSQQDLASIIGKSTNLVSQIVNGKRAVTPETAVTLGAAFGTDAELWLNLQNAFDLSRVPRCDEVARRSRVFSKAPVAEMIQRGWIENTTNVDVLELRVKEHFELESLDDDFTLPYAARKTAAQEIDYSETSPAQWAWLFRAKHLSKAAPVSRSWDAERMPELIDALRALLLSAEEARHTARICGEYGVRFLAIEPLAGTRIDGACFWLDDRSPVIVVSLRFDRIDNFWFTVFHECGHVDQGESAVDVDILVGEKPEFERRANEFAQECLLPQEEFEKFRARKGHLCSRRDVQGFAARMNLHPGIVAGRIQFADQDFRLFREMLVKVRQYVTEGALTDGWGSPAPPVGR